MPSASPWYASIAGRMASTAPHAAAVPWSETALMRPKLTGSGIGARHARDASTTSPARCWPGITSRCVDKIDDLFAVLASTFPLTVSLLGYALVFGLNGGRGMSRSGNGELYAAYLGL